MSSTDNQGQTAQATSAATQFRAELATLHRMIDQAELWDIHVEPARVKAASRIHKYKYGYIIEFATIDGDVDDWKNESVDWLNHTAQLVWKFDQVEALHPVFTRSLERAQLRLCQRLHRHAAAELAVLEKLHSVVIGLKDEEYLKNLRRRIVESDMLARGSAVILDANTKNEKEFDIAEECYKSVISVWARKRMWGPVA